MRWENRTLQNHIAIAHTTFCELNIAAHIFVMQHTVSITTNLSTTIIHQFTYRNTAFFYVTSGIIYEHTLDGHNFSVPLSSRNIILPWLILFAYRYSISHNWHWNNTLNYPRPQLVCLSMYCIPVFKYFHCHNSSISIEIIHITCYVQLHCTSSRMLHFYEPRKIKVLYIFIYQPVSSHVTTTQKI